jgi:hypothetical protein
MYMGRSLSTKKNVEKCAKSSYTRTYPHNPHKNLFFYIKNQGQKANKYFVKKDENVLNEKRIGKTIDNLR